jgi:hypothetical protein
MGKYQTAWSVKTEDEEEEGCGRKRSWYNRDTIPVFVRKAWIKTRTSRQRFELGASQIQVKTRHWLIHLAWWYHWRSAYKSCSPQNPDFQLPFQVFMYVKWHRTFFFNIGGGVYTGSTRHCGHSWFIVPTPGDCDDGEIGGINGFGRGNRSTRRKPVPTPLRPPQIPLARPGR